MATKKATRKKGAEADAARAVSKWRSKYGKELVRIGVQIDDGVALAIEAAEELPGVAPQGFMIDRGNGKVWLVYSVDDRDACDRLAAVTEPMQMKMAGYLPK